MHSKISCQDLNFLKHVDNLALHNGLVMKKYNVIVILALLGLFLATSCTKAPEACISIREGRDRITAGEELHFIANCSQNAEQITWIFEETNRTQVISRQSVKYRFNSPGAHTVRLITSNNRSSAEAAHTIIVYPN
ncbi:MAG: PKD domain-containing protein [Bacteroidia bacterium]